jgi:hypothetical protein
MLRMLFCAGVFAAASMFCSLPLESTAQQSLQPNAVDIILPKALNPSGRSFKLSPGTQVFRRPTYVIRYVETVNGQTINNEKSMIGIPGGPAPVITRSVTGMEVRYGKLVYSNLPDGITVTRGNDALRFVPPGASRPAYIGKDTKPDFVVPGGP